MIIYVSKFTNILFTAIYAYSIYFDYNFEALYKLCPGLDFLKKNLIDFSARFLFEQVCLAYFCQSSNFPNINLTNIRFLEYAIDLQLFGSISFFTKFKQ